MVSNVNRPVLIVGAGPTGMMAAMELSRFGVPVRLVEKALKPATTSRAVGVQARTLELFEQRGLSDALLATGNPGRAVSVYGAGKLVFRLNFEGIDSKFNYILFVSQAETEKVLRDALQNQGVQVDWNVAMVGFSQADKDAGVTAILQHGDGSLEKVDCAYLISAEGSHSAARETSRLIFEGKSLKESYALGDFYIDGDLSDTDLHIFSSVHGFLGMFPMGNKRFRLIASNPVSTPSKDTTPSMRELQQLYDQRSTIPVRFRDMSWSSWFHINSRMIQHMRTGHVFLGGDAAHIHSPAGAQGMNTGMQDMVDLGWKMAMVMKGQANPELLDTYSLDRVPIIKEVLTKTEGLTQAIGNENPLFRSVFNHIAPWVVDTATVQHNSTERMSQLGLNYRDSTLSASAGHAGSLQAGDRLPDLPVAELMPQGSTIRQPRASTLFKLMDPSMFTLLYSNISDPERTHSEIQKAVGCWLYLMRGHQIGKTDTDDGRFARLFGSSSSILLVRPDGYIAFTGSETSIPALVNFCEKWLLPQSSPKAKAQDDPHAQL